MMSFLPALFGGIMIGAAAGLYMLFNGRIMGMSGIVGGILTKNFDRGFIEKVLFTCGTIFAPFVYVNFAPLPEIEITSNVLLLIAGGLLVGFGSRMGSGCTSGHGVCGLGRFSKRSLVAVMTFMLTAIVTVYIVRHVLG